MKPLAALLHRSFEAYPERTAIVCGDVEVSYRELELQVAARAEALRRWGLVSGAKAALVYPNEPDFIVTFLAVQKLGAVACPLNVESTEGEFQQLLVLIDPDVVITSDMAIESRRIIEHVWRGSVLATAEVEETPADLAVNARPVDAVLVDVAIILCTSGTTGLPKAAMLTHESLVGNLHAFRDHLRSFPGRDWHEHEVFGNPIPLSHPYGLIMMTLMPLFLGGTTVQIPRFTPTACLETIERRGVTLYGGVPSMYAMLNRSRRKKQYDVTSCRLWVSGGAPLPRPVADEFTEHFGTHISEGFGMLETSSLASLNFETPLRHPTSVGPFHAQMKAEIRDDSGRVLPAGEVGELWVAGPNIMKGYYRNPEATSDALIDGWLRTGDLGAFDADGHCYLKGRLKELMIVGGHNVYPREIENVLLSDERIADAAVASENDPVRGERILAFVVPVDEGGVVESELLIRCRSQLSPYKTPRAIHFVPAIPRNPSGKIMRKQLVEQFAATELQQSPSPVGSAAQ